MDFEDENDTIEEINDKIAEQKREAEIKHAETIAQMEKNKQDFEDNRKLVTELSQAMGVHQIQEDLDVLKNAINSMNTNISALNESIVKIVGIVDQHTHILNNTPQPQQSGPVTNTPNEAKLMQLGELAKTLADVWRTVKGNDAPTAPTGFLTQDYINQQVSNAVKRKFELVDIVVDSVESALTKGLTKEIVKNTLKNAATNITHEPE